MYVCERQKEHVYDCVSAFVRSGGGGGGSETEREMGGGGGVRKRTCV